MSIETARWLLIVLGVTMPYLARVPRGRSWLQDYLKSGWGGFGMLSLSNAPALLVLLAISWMYEHTASMLLASSLLLAYLAYAHHSLDLQSDSREGLNFLIFPVVAVPVALGSGLLGWVLDHFFL